VGTAESALDLVTRLTAAIAEDRVDDALALVHTDAVWRPVSRPGLTQYRGREGVRQFFADVARANGPYRVEIDAIEAVPADRVTVTSHVVVVTEFGDKAGPPIVSVFTVRDGLVLTMEAEPG